MSVEKLLFPLLLGLTAAVCCVVPLVGCTGIRRAVSGDGSLPQAFKIQC